jgi:tripartite-type tricarboxylate transporter receptor subunit TctC
MNAELQAALKTPEVAEKLSRSGIEPAGGSVADFAAFIASERKRLGDIAVKAKMSEQ